jgi:DNA-binding GntR family transcriptional regulator
VDGLEITLDRSTPIPLYQQVAQQIETAIHSGQLHSGQRLDTEVDLAQQLGVSRPTVGQAIRLLVNKGLLVRRRGAGTLVMGGGEVRRSMELTSLYEDLQKSGHEPRTQVLRLELLVPDDEVRGELQGDAGQPAWMVERVRFVGSEPLALMVNYVLPETADISRFDLDHGGLYESLRESGIEPSLARQRISCRRATAAEAAILHEDIGAPLLTMERTAFDKSGRTIEYGRHAYRPSLYSFDLTVVER